MFVVKCEIVHVEDDLYEVTKSFRGDELIGTFAKEKAASLNTFTVRDVCIKRSDVKRDKYGIVGKCVDYVQDGKFVKEISTCSVFNERRNSTPKLMALGSSQQTKRYVLWGGC